MTQKEGLTRLEAIDFYFNGIPTRFDDARRAGHLKTYKLGRKVLTTRKDCEACIAYQQKQSDKGKPVVYRQRPESRRRA